MSTKKQVKKDLTGCRFGSLVVVEQADDYVTPKRQQHIDRWKCLCDCGQIVYALGYNLNNGHTHSCGCATVAKRNQTRLLALQQTLQECVGKSFGDLIVEEVLTQVDTLMRYNQIKVRCRCSCGSIIETNWGALHYGKRTHCGCKRTHLVYGVGHFDGATNESVINLPVYRVWFQILRRCYDEKTHQRQPTYQNCAVCNEWLTYSNFKQWYLANQWYNGDERIHVDKDLLFKGNRTYGPQACVIIPQSLNCLLTKSEKARGDYPIGVSYHKKMGMYVARVGIDGRNVNLGEYWTPEEAFQAYKIAKEKLIKQTADEYKAKYPEFPQKLYDAMYAYEVEITD